MLLSTGFSGQTEFQLSPTAPAQVTGYQTDRAVGRRLLDDSGGERGGQGGEETDCSLRLPQPHTRTGGAHTNMVNKKMLGLIGIHLS